MEKNQEYIKRINKIKIYILQDDSGIAEEIPNKKENFAVYAINIEIKHDGADGVTVD